MIRKSENPHLLVDVWLNASISAHDFIPAGYWVENKNKMRDFYLPSSENFVYTDDYDNILGFISLSEGKVEALFVEPDSQGRGIGSQLLDFAKLIYPELSLQVYENNKGAVGFYLNNGFRIQSRSIDNITGENQLLMRFSRE